jgi:hypothetical protein
MNHGRRQSMRSSGAFAPVGLDVTNPADSLVSVTGCTYVAPLGDSPMVFIAIDEVPK